MQHRTTTAAAAGLDLGVEDLESLEAPDDSSDFFTGVLIGLAIVSIWAT